MDSKVYVVHWQTEHDGNPRFREFDEETDPKALRKAKAEVQYILDKMGIYGVQYKIEPHIDFYFKHDVLEEGKK